MKKNRIETSDAPIQISKPNRKKKNGKIKRQNKMTKTPNQINEPEDELMEYEEYDLGEDAHEFV